MNNNIEARDNAVIIPLNRAKDYRIDFGYADKAGQPIDLSAFVVRLVVRGLPELNAIPEVGDDPKRRVLVINRQTIAALKEQHDFRVEIEHPDDVVDIIMEGILVPYGWTA
jgi:hypothetical protein